MTLSTSTFDRRHRFCIDGFAVEFSSVDIWSGEKRAVAQIGNLFEMLEPGVVWLVAHANTQQFEKLIYLVVRVCIVGASGCVLMLWAVLGHDIVCGASLQALVGNPKGTC